MFLRVCIIVVDLFQNKLQANIIEEALTTPGVEPTRSRYSQRLPTLYSIRNRQTVVHVVIIN